MSNSLLTDKKPDVVAELEDIGLGRDFNRVTNVEIRTHGYLNVIPVLTKKLQNSSPFNTTNLKKLVYLNFLFASVKHLPKMPRMGNIYNISPAKNFELEIIFETVLLYC